MQRNYSTFVMLRRAMSLSVFLEFSSNASRFYFSLLVIPLTFNLVFQLHYVLCKISFVKPTPMKVQYLQIHTNQFTHPCPTMTMTLMMVSLPRTMVMEIQRSICAGQILLMQCGRAIWITWQMRGQLTVMMMIFLRSWLRVCDSWRIFSIVVSHGSCTTCINILVANCNKNKNRYKTAWDTASYRIKRTR